MVAHRRRLGRDFRVITFDNRGVGRSRGLAPACTTEALADDAVAVLDALEIERANVYGLSLGDGRQQIALRHPRRVRSLVLGATTPGGRRAQAADAEVMIFHGRGQRPREEAAWASCPTTTAAVCRDDHADRIAEDVRHRLAYAFDEDAYKAQLMAAALHNCASRLHRHHRSPRSSSTARTTASYRWPTPMLIASRLPEGRLHLLEGTGTSTRPRRPRPTPRSPASLDASSLARQETRARPRRRPGSSVVYRCAASSNSSRRAPAIPAASARPFAGGTIRSSAPCTTSVGAAISPSRAAASCPAPPRAARRNRRIEPVRHAGARSPRRCAPRRAARALAVHVRHGRPAALLVGDRRAAREKGQRLAIGRRRGERRPRRSRRARASRRAPGTQRELLGDHAAHRDPVHVRARDSAASSTARRPRPSPQA